MRKKLNKTIRNVFSFPSGRNKVTFHIYRKSADETDFEYVCKEKTGEAVFRRLASTLGYASLGHLSERDLSIFSTTEDWCNEVDTNETFVDIDERFMVVASVVRKFDAFPPRKLFRKKL